MAALPHFYYKGTLTQGIELQLEEDTARHIIQVLRMQTGDQVQLTNGAGFACIATIASADKKRCRVLVQSVNFYEQPAPRLFLGVAFTKNTSRNEWLLEKATELGAHAIIPLMTKRTEREKIRYDRWTSILVSAMMQSQQYYLPDLQEATSLNELLKKYNDITQKLIGHCNEEERQLLSQTLKPQHDTIVLIGPEGDFTTEEVDLCTQHAYKGISMGNQRLRTETAAMSVCAYFNMINHA